MALAPAVERAREALHRLYVGREGARLREEDERKAAELAGLATVVAELLRKTRKGTPLRLVDAAAGKGGAGLYLAEAVLAPAIAEGRAPSAEIHLIERDPRRVALIVEASSRLRAPGVVVRATAADVGDRAAWPQAPTFVTALHACGAATDAALDAAIAARARFILLAPCCTARSVADASGATAAACRLGIPEHGVVRQAFAEAFVLAERTLRLEAAGFETEVAAFVPESVTPYNKLLRARRVGEPNRSARAAADLARLRAGGAELP